MARTPQYPYRPDPPPDLKLSPLFDIEGKEGAAEWVRENMKMACDAALDPRPHHRRPHQILKGAW